jgi:hypothetical protein
LVQNALLSGPTVGRRNRVAAGDDLVAQLERGQTTFGAML